MKIDKKRLDDDKPKLTREQKERLLIKLKKMVGMSINEKFIHEMDEFELNVQIKHYKNILSTIYTY